MEEIIGYIAASGTMASLLPQVWKVVRTRETKDISRLMYVIYTAAGVLWLIYGFLKQDWPIVATNVVTVASSAIILIYKLRCG